MKRINFVQSLLVVPATAVAAEQVAAPPAPTQTPAAAAARSPQNLPRSPERAEVESGSTRLCRRHNY